MDKTTKTLRGQLLEFQMKQLTVGKDSTNPAFKSKYASLSGILNEITPALNELELLVIHTIEETKCTTSICFGQDFISSSFALFGSKAQEFGSSITYAKRYNLGALLNLNIDDDDDGNHATASKKMAKRGLSFVIRDIGNAPTLNALMALYNEGMDIAKNDVEAEQVKNTCSLRKAYLNPDVSEANGTHSEIIK